MLDSQRLIGEVAAKNGVRLDANDPAFALVTLNQLVLEETVAHLIENISLVLTQFSESLGKTERRAGSMLAQDAKIAASKFEAALLAQLQPQNQQAHTQSKYLRLAEWKWSVLGIVSATLLFGVGFALGVFIGGH